MKIIQRLSDVGASDEALARVESTIGGQLPADYRAFMSEFNGGRPEPSGFVFDCAGGQSDSAIRYFLTLDNRQERYTIDEFLERYRGRMPEHLLPIACDSFGNVVLLDVCARAAGSICFWDHEGESMGEPTWDNIAVLAPTFEAFLKSLE